MGMKIAIRIILLVVSVVTMFFLGDLSDLIGKRWTDSSPVLTVLNILVLIAIIFGLGILLRDLVELLNL